jgi:hypothetical protein
MLSQPLVVSIQMDRSLTQSHRNAYFTSLTSPTGRTSQLACEGVDWGYKHLEPGFQPSSYTSQQHLTSLFSLRFGNKLTTPATSHGYNLTRLPLYRSTSRLDKHTAAADSKQHFAAGRPSTRAQGMSIHLMFSLQLLHFALIGYGTCLHGNHFTFTCSCGPCALAVYVLTLHIPRFSSLSSIDFTPSF